MPHRVLVLARSYPNPELPTLALWTQRLTHLVRPDWAPTVFAPVPCWPLPFALPGHPRWFRVPGERDDEGVAVHHFRVPAGPGHWLHAHDARRNEGVVLEEARRRHASTPFDLIHAHFVFPDGVLAARLGSELRLPVIVTEHASWDPWLTENADVRSQVLAALPNIQLLTAPSPTTLEGLRAISGSSAPLELLPNVVDDRIFVTPPDSVARDPDLVLFVGAARWVKGLDLLVRALATARRTRPSLRLEVVGDPYYASYRRDERTTRKLVDELGLDSVVRFLGRQAPSDVAASMGRAGVLALPSRRETFGAAAAEALACGTPVVATRCGGPEAFVDDAVGRLVPLEDPEAFAQGLVDVVGQLDAFPRSRLRARVIPAFGRETIRRVLLQLYARCCV